jgi:nicotinamide-nucleotide amidase
LFPTELIELTNKLISGCRKNDLKIATAESCTGGLIAACLTSVAGSSDVFERGFNTYSNYAKSELVNIPRDVITANGAVSRIVALAMCEGALKISPVQLTVSVTGIAGPAGGTFEKPVGTVHIASARVGKSTIERSYFFPGNRNQIRLSTIEKALEMMLSQV